LQIAVPFCSSMVASKSSFSRIFEDNGYRFIRLCHEKDKTKSILGIFL
jgi:hypothetical protein